MKKRSLKEWCIRLLVMLLGLTAAHFGVMLFLRSNLGSDPFTVLVQGISVQTGLTVGTVHIIVNAVLIVLMLIFARGYVLPGTVVCALCGGPIIDFWTWLAGGLIPDDLAFGLKLLVAAIGCVVLAAGMSLVIRSDAGTGPNDLVSVILTDKIKKVQFRWVRILCDALFVLTGWLLGATVGVGTIIAVVLIGPAAQLFMPLDDRFIHLCLGKKHAEEAK